MNNIIEVKNLVKNYKDVHAVNDISFTVEEGSFFAFLGINGAGKSTTINILCTVLEKHQAMLKSADMTLTKKRTKSRSLSELFFRVLYLTNNLPLKKILNRERHITDSTKKKSPKELKALHKPLTFLKFSKENTAH